MQKFNKNSLVTIVSVLCALGLFGPIAAFASTAPSLGTASTFGIVSSTFTNSNTAPQTVITGDICYTTPPTTAPVTITGATVTPCASGTGTAQSSALADLNSQACTSLGTNVVLAGTYTPGCYSASGSMDIVANTTVTLNGPGVYIFKSVGAVTTGANSAVALAGGASATDVFWAPVAATTLGASTAFVGTILDAAGISLGHFATLLGRALAFGGTVTTDANTITVPSSSALATLHIVKSVINNNGGSAFPSDFTLHVKTSASVDIAGSPATGMASPGKSYAIAAGTYTVSEDTNASYTSNFSSSCPGGTITLSASDDQICTITNTYISEPRIQPANGNGSGYVAPVTPPFVVAAAVPPPLIGIVKVPSRLTPFPFGGGTVIYSYTVTNPGVIPLHDVVVTDDKCAPVSRPFGDANGNTLLDPGEAWAYACVTNVRDSTKNIATAQGTGNGLTALGYAFATVLVSPLVPALPNTGLPPENKSALVDMVLLSGILFSISFLFVTLRSHRGFRTER